MFLDNHTHSRSRNGALPAPIHLTADELLYLYNKCKDNLHLLAYPIPWYGVIFVLVYNTLMYYKTMV